MAKAGFQEVSGGAGRINGLEAYVGVYDGTIEATPVRMRAAHVRSGGQIYLVAGLATLDAFSAADRNFAQSIGSFRALSEAEADKIQPSRVTFHVVRAGETWESLARLAGPFGGPSPSTLAIMNGSDLATPPRAGARVRIVIAG
jgi:predicted Zn-dependent protease